MKKITLLFLVITTFLFIMQGCSEPTKPITVSNVYISPNSATVQKGQTQQFTATVNGTNNPPQTVTWMVTGSSNTETSISNSGLLSVANTETVTTLTVKATSTHDTSKSRTATVTIPQPTVTNVIVSPSTISVVKGNTQQFTAVVNGTNNPPQTVTWTVTNGHTGTSISTSGLLTVASSETSTSLTVRATSTFNTSRYNTATVTVTNPVATVTSVVVSPDSVSVTKGTTKQFTATVSGDNNPPQTVIWTVQNAHTGTSISTSGLLTIATNESSTSLVVRATSTHDNSKFGTATVTVLDPPPTVTTVVISASSLTITRGQQLQFTATVDGSYNPPQGVTWTLAENQSPDTNIDTTSGLLSVSINETSPSLNVRATSTFDTSKYGQVTITVESGVTSVSVTPSTPTVPKGQEQQFSAVVNSTNDAPQGATWSIIGNHHSSTSIDSDGLLTISINENTSPLIIRATSTYDNTKYGTANVTVSVPSVSSITVTPPSVSVLRGETQEFSAVVNGTNSPPQTVTWSIPTSHHTNTTINATTGLLTISTSETMTTLTVRATSTYNTSIYGNATVTVSSGVTGVAVTPPTATVAKGATQQFNASVNGEGDLPQDVTWTRTGNNSSNTTISSAGLLSVASNETATTITVKATSTYDTTYFGEATVTVVSGVTSVVVSPSTISVPKGQQHTFTAVVNGNPPPPQTVTWSVSGGITGTNINSSGVLTIAIFETASVLTLTATSTYDSTISGSATVTVLTPTVTSVIVNPNPISVPQGGGQQFTAEVNGTHNPPVSVTWEVIGGNTGTSIDSDSGYLTVSNGETASTLTVKATSTYDLDQSGTATVTVSTITGVQVSPTPMTILRGGQQQYSATVDGTNSPPQTVNWTVTGGNTGTSINTSGLLTVGSGESSSSLSVRATSTASSSYYGTASVTVPQVTTVVVSPATASVNMGATQPFTAVVNGHTDLPQSVTWTVTGGGTGTSINASGILTVGASQAVTTLTVRATSTYDTSKNGTATVTVVDPYAIWTVNNPTDWSNAVDGIRNAGGNRNYTINVTNNVQIPVSPSFTFGNLTGITVSIQGNYTLSSVANGRLLYIGGGQAVILVNIILQGLASNSASLVVTEGTLGNTAIFSMEGSAKIMGNTRGSNSAGGGVYVGEYSTFTMKDSSQITGCSASNGGGVYLCLNTTFTMQDNSSISNNSSTYSGGGVSTIEASWSSSTLNITLQGSASIYDNSASYYGGGVCIRGGTTTFTMSNYSSISNNESGGSGGGIRIEQFGYPTFTMQNNATISGNISLSSGGGVDVWGTTFLMKDHASVSNNIFTGGGFDVGGGGVHSGNGSFTMQDNASVTGNTIQVTNSPGSGGGVYMSGNSSFTMRGNATISNNTLNSNNTTYGGGISIGNAGSFTFEGGIISNNTTSSSTYAYGGGLYLSSSNTAVIIQGTGTTTDAIFGNTASGSSAYGGGIYSARPLTLQNRYIRQNTVTATSQAFGGGIYMAGNNGDNTLTMTSGVIWGNTVSSTSTDPQNKRGGGTYGALEKTGGVIYGSNAATNLRNMATGGKGHAASQSGTNAPFRNPTADQSMNTSNAGFWESLDD